METTLVVLSDLHIASGKLDDCDEELEHHFVSFVDSLCRRDRDIELVLNGDFLDFVQADPWCGPELESVSKNGVPLCFTENQSVEKFDSIHRAHRPIFDALREFLSARTDNRLTILPGNHDPDFYWSEVRKRFREHVGEVRFFFDQVYRPAAHPSVWLEHGHQSDPVNCFKWDGTACWSDAIPPIFYDLDGERRLYECPGTRFLIKFLNRLDEDYPFVDNVKPFGRFVRIFGASAMMPGYGTLKVALTIGRMLAYINSIVLHHPADVLGLKHTEDLLRGYLQKRFATAPRADLDSLADRLTARGFTVEQPLPMYLETAAAAEPLLAFLTEHFELLDDFEIPGSSLLGESVPGTLTMAAGFNADETGDLIRTAEQALARDGVELVIMGHTHEVVPKSVISYINTGSWTRYYRFAPDEKTVPWDVLRSDSYVTFPYELNYVEIPPSGADAARLIHYQDRHA